MTDIDSDAENDSIAGFDLHFPIESMQKRLEDAKISNGVQQEAAIFCSSVLQVITQRVLMEAVKSVESKEDAMIDAIESLQQTMPTVKVAESLSPKNDSNIAQQSKINSRKRRRSVDIKSSEGDSSQSETGRGGNIFMRPNKRRKRICPRDIKHALHNDNSLKQWANKIQTPLINPQNSGDTLNSQQNKQRQLQSNDCLNGVLIGVESNLGVIPFCDTYCKQIKRALQSTHIASQYRKIHESTLTSSTQTMADVDTIVKSVATTNESMTDSADTESIIPVYGYHLSEKLSTVLTDAFDTAPKENAMAWLCQLSSALSQRLQSIQSILCSTSTSTGDDNGRIRFGITDRTPVSCLAMAMLFANRQWLNSNQLKLYLNAHQSEMFSSAIKPDITVYLETDTTKEVNSQKWDRLASKELLQSLDDFQFELVMKQIARHRHSKILFFDSSHFIANDCAQTILDVLRNKREPPCIFWDGRLTTIDTNVPNMTQRLIYSNAEQIKDGLKMIQTGTLSVGHIVYVHISLWMKPKHEFKRLILAHLCRFENICFYAVGPNDLDARATQIVRWIFTQ